MRVQGRDATNAFGGTADEAITAQLRQIAKSGHVAHAYLITGDAGSGKRGAAALFARALQCTGEGEKPCGTCLSCKKALGGNHPDIRYLLGEKEASIGVDEVREQLVNDVAVRPYESPYKVYIIDEAEKLTVQAQNAILKTIEEPPSYAVILLLAVSAEALLPTVVSRCVRLDIADADGREIAPEVLGNAIQLMKRSRSMDVITMIETVKGLASEKNNLREYLDAFLLWFRDVLLFKATRDADALLFPDELAAIRERAAISGYDGLDEILEAIGVARERLYANVSPELTLELLFLTIKEN